MRERCDPTNPALCSVLVGTEKRVQGHSNPNPRWGNAKSKSDGRWPNQRNQIGAKEQVLSPPLLFLL